MSWSEPRRRVLALGALGAGLALASCGFTPLYAPGESAAALRGNLAVTAPATLTGYRLAERIEERLGAPEGPPGYALSVTLEVSPRGEALTGTGALTRYRVAGVADWRLETADGAEVGRGTVDAFTGYSATASTVATAAAAEDAEARLAVQLADLLVTRLLALELP